MTVSVAFLLMPLLYLSAFNPQNADVPQMSTRAEYADGSVISVAYRAEASGSLLAGAGIEASAKESIRNGRVLATLSSNVQLTIGAVALDPGSYELGFFAQEDQWYVVIYKEGEVLTQLPILMREEEEMTRYLTFFLQPGVTGKDFIFTCLYGNLTTSLRWMISGIPVRHLNGELQRNDPVLDSEIFPERRDILQHQGFQFYPDLYPRDDRSRTSVSPLPEKQDTVNSRTRGGLFKRFYEIQNQIEKDQDE